MKSEIARAVSFDGLVHSLNLDWKYSGWLNGEWKNCCFSFADSGAAAKSESQPLWLCDKNSWDTNRKLSDYVRATAKKWGKWHKLSGHTIAHKLSWCLDLFLAGSELLWHDDETVKMKQYFKRNFIYICLATACLSLVSGSRLWPLHLFYRFR